MENEFKTQYQYEQAVKSIAETVQDPSYWNEFSEENETERIFERVESSRWAFITYGAMQTMLYTKNEDAIFEFKDEIDGTQPYRSIACEFATYAMFMDVWDLIHNGEDS